MPRPPRGRPRPRLRPGQGKANVNLSIDLAEFLAARRHHDSLFDLDVEGGATETAIIREIQYDAFGDTVAHVEFRRVTRGVAIESEVELVFVGQSRGGVLTPLVRVLTVKAIPSNIPDVIEVAADRFTEGRHVKASEIPLPAGVELAEDPDLDVAVVASATAVDTATEETAEGETPAAE
ncbi:MAG: 50S ribosomal protein L25 [Planctomycetota bacterium]